MKNSIDFKEYNDECPCYIDGKCCMQITYNGHINDPQYELCCEPLCPVFFWLSILLSGYDK